MTRFLRYALAVAALAGAVSPALAAADEPDGEVTGVSLISSPGRAEVVVTVLGAVEITDFVLHSPERLVLDVQGAILRPGVRTLYDGVNRGGVRNIRYNQFRPDVVRIVLEFDQLKDYEIERVQDEIRVSFGSERSFLAWSATAPAELAAPSDATPASRRPEVELPEERTLAAAPVQTQQPRITVTWFKASIGDVVAGFAAFSGRTIIMGKDVEGEVTAEIKNQPWDQAFEAILATQGLSAQEMPGGIIRVDSPAALAALDSLEPLQTQLVRVNYAKAASLAKSIEGILTKDRGSVVPDTGSNTLIITDTRSRLGGIAEFVSQLDIRTPQIAIQAKIIFVDRSDLQELGLQYDLGDRDVFFNKLVQRFDPSSGESFDPNTVVIGGSSVAAIANADADITNSALDLVWRTTVGGFSLTTFLSALERIELADVQAEPIISTLDNREADILVGEETPIRVIDVSSATSAGTPPRASVQLKETGIRLTVTPHVTNNRQILMELRTERSAVQALAAADLGFNFPKQFASNQLLVNDGETAVIGGLTITEITRTRSGIPLLSGLPLVGNLFSFSSDQERRRDLIILVTPRIIDDGGLPPAP
jgi:type IV pilus assembly protein PilQ